MKRFVRALSVAAAFAMPVVAHAQLSLTSLTVSGGGPGRINAGAGGGRFEAVAIGPMLVPGPQNILVFCIELEQQFSPGTTYTNYTMYTFPQFLALNYRGINTLGDLNTMVANANTISLGAGTNANTAQGNSWDIMAVVQNGASSLATNEGWFVLHNTPKNQNGGYTVGTGNQTFLARVTTVPEPSSFAIVAVALVGLGVATRRRRRSK